MQSLSNGRSKEQIIHRPKTFSTQVELFKKIAKSTWIALPDKDVVKQHSKINKFDSLAEILKNEVSSLSMNDVQKPETQVNDRIISITVFMYLVDSVLEMHPLVMGRNKVGLYALFNSVCDSIYTFLTDGYFEKSTSEIVYEFHKIEPRFVACANLVELEVIPVHEAVGIYQSTLAELITLVQKDKTSGKKSKSKKPPAKKSVKAKPTNHKSANLSKSKIKRSKRSKKRR
ncbi:hypothetical protein KKF81_06255 [Candidatus Micrarchaeota archaeon]|nr:hypothetical protein [Candidatus Micrarchaeota archaeon]MBU1166532.1 hypothetical protein [Candidatus Micrarchaeota archaeon]MBU1887544.1 hypothetical protein [Candidatus Micrarchaeota archaeon]